MIVSLWAAGNHEELDKAEYLLILRLHIQAQGQLISQKPSHILKGKQNS